MLLCRGGWNAPLRRIFFPHMGVGVGDDFFEDREINILESVDVEA
jgi:hypothetical protein